MKINWHTVRTIALLVAAFIVGGLQAVHAIIPTAFAGTVDTIIAVLLFLEHQLAGKSELATPAPIDDDTTDM